MMSGPPHPEPVPLGVLFDGAAGRFTDAPVLRLGAIEITHGEFGEQVDRCAGLLAASGVGVGARVALSAQTSVEFVAAVVAVARLGGCTVMVSTSWHDREVKHAIGLTHPTHVVHDGSGAASIGELLAVPTVHVDELASAPPAEHLPLAPVGLDDIAVMVFSSGTTGLPKAVRHTHRSIFHAIGHWIEALGLDSTDRLQVATPPFHILGLLNIFAVLSAGASMRLHRRFDLDAVLESVGRDGITVEMAVAPIALAMANHPDLERFDLSSLRYIMWGATPVSSAVANTVTRRSGVRFLAAYGASELPVISANPVRRPDEWRLDSVGLAPTGVELRVVDLATGDVVAPGEPGELEARSPSMMAGYLPEDANADAFDAGWYRTGDVGTVDVDGWVTITDRVKEMIKVNGFQVAPAEVESLLIAHPGVIDCAVFGVPDPRTGEAVVAAVVLADQGGVEIDDLVAAVGSELASYKRIADIVVLDQIPRLPSGKVLRRELVSNHRS